MNGMRYFSNNHTRQNKGAMIMNMMNYNNIKPKPLNNDLNKPNITNPVSNTSTTTQNSQPKRNIKWGAPIWHLFHTLAEKVNEEYFPNIRKEILDIIYVICVNLPCPDCANHAKSYMDNINFNTLVTKHDLKFMLFTFHNSVNQRIGAPQFSIDELDPLYSRGNLINIIHIFMAHFKDKQRSIRMIANDFHRSNVSDKLQVWFQKNIQYFDL